MRRARRLSPISSDTLAEIREFSERRLSIEELRTALAIPIGDEERAEVLSLTEWFLRRYPTPAERLAYVRRAYRRWKGRE